MAHAIPRITLLGPVALRIGNRRQKLPFAGQTRRLFVYLAGHANTGVRRDCLLEEIWPDTAPARAGSGLNSAVWRIKNGLAQYAGVTVECVDDIVRLTVEDPTTIDVHALQTAVTGVADGTSPLIAADAFRHLRDAVMACRGPFLDGCAEHWVLPLRERYTALQVRALTFLMYDRAARGAYEAALAHGQAILALDPFREGTQREVMWLYALNGQRAQAVRQYRALENLLQTELGIDPMPETATLFKKITQARDSVARIMQASARDGSLHGDAISAFWPNLTQENAVTG